MATEEKKDLALEKKNQEIEKEVLKIRNGEIKISDILADAPNAQEIVDKAIEAKPLFFRDTREDQRTDANAFVFVKHILTTTKVQNEKEVAYFETLNSSPALSIHYESVADESVEYFDKDLELPTQLKSKLSLSLVIADALRLLNALNFKLNDFSLARLYNVIRAEITRSVKAKILEYIQRERLGYFGFEFACATLSESVQAELALAFEKYGLQVIKFHFDKLSIPDQIIKIVQDEYMNARALSIRSKAELQWATSSLEILKLKSEIIDKHHLPADTLSEMEKDKALDRYLKKMEGKVETKIEFKKEKATNANSEDILVATLPVEPKKPDEIGKNSNAKLIGFSLGAVVGLILGIVGLTIQIGGLVAFGFIATVALGVLDAVAIVQKTKGKKLVDDYKMKLSIYEEGMKAYAKEYAEYEEANRKLTANPNRYYKKDGAIYEKRTPII